MTEKPCNLSSLKIKSVKVEGDKDEYVARALKAKLYRLGARLDPKGEEIIGVVSKHNMMNWPLEATVEIPTRAFASVAFSGGAPNQVIAVDHIADQITNDFCACSAGQRELPRKE